MASAPRARSIYFVQIFPIGGTASQAKAAADTVQVFIFTRLYNILEFIHKRQLQLSPAHDRNLRRSDKQALFVFTSSGYCHEKDSLTDLWRSAAGHYPEDVSAGKRLLSVPECLQARSRRQKGHWECL